jgi:Lon protease-like protein
MARKSSDLNTPADYSNNDVVRLEKDSLAKANRAISSIENALAVWNASKVKPEEMAARVNKLRYFHDALSRWEKKMLKAMASTQDVQERIGRLREFSDICYMYSQG